MDSLITTELLDRLRRAATEAVRGCYARYSGFEVLAAIERVDGRVFGGANVEVVNYSLTKHAEEAAVMAALHSAALDLGDKWLRTVYVRGAAPCGSCRQFLWEWAVPEAVCVIDRGGENVSVRSLASLLPDAFDPSELADRRPKR